MRYEIKTHVDDELKVVIYEKVPHGYDPASPTPPTQYSGTAAIPVLMTHPNGQTQQMQHQYQFPIEADDISDAFAKFECARAVAEIEEKRRLVEQERQKQIAQAAQQSQQAPRGLIIPGNGSRRPR